MKLDQCLLNGAFYCSTIRNINTFSVQSFPNAMQYTCILVCKIVLSVIFAVVVNITLRKIMHQVSGNFPLNLFIKPLLPNDYTSAPDKEI